MEHWTKSLDDSNNVDIVYLDFCKAFDCVPHQLVLSKLEAYGISGNVLNWIMDFLSNRWQRVNVNGSCSDWCNVLSGVPLWSVVGPLLFIVYINDLYLKLSKVILLFLPMTPSYIIFINTPDNSSTLQSDLDLLVECCRAWQIKFNFVNIYVAITWLEFSIQAIAT